MPRLPPRMALVAWLAALLFSLNAAGEYRSADFAFASSGLSFGVANFGFPERIEIQETAQEIRIELAADVLFDFDKADIRPDATAALAEAAALIRQKSRGPVRVEGHTDSKGGDAYNQRLSERRAAAVVLWLKNRNGLTSTQFQTAGFGSHEPVAPNEKPDGSDDPDGRQKNRRVSLIMQK